MVLDWQSLKTEYKVGTIKSVNAFLKVKGIRLSGNTIRHIKGWSSERESYQIELQRRIEDKSRNKTAEIFSDDYSEVQKRHAKIGRSLQAKGLEGLLKHKPRNAMEAMRMFVEGARLERQVLGLDDIQLSGDEKEPAFMKTHYAKRLKSMSLEELVKELVETHGINNPPS